VHKARRSSRLALSIPVEIVGLDAAGTEIHEKAATKVVSKHGAYLFLVHRLQVGSELMLRVPHVNREQKCKIAWVGSTFGDHGPFETGVELESAENLWGVQFPPEDWVAPEQTPLAGERPGTLSPQDLSSDNERQLMAVNAIVNALIVVLEEKGVVTRSELSDKLKRFH